MIQVNRIYLIFNRLVTKKFLVDTSVTILQFTIYYLAAQYMLHGTIYNFTIYYLLFTMYNLPCGVYCAAK